MPSADTIKDDLDRSDIDQLHKAVLQFGANCFELKKLCATVLIAASTLIATFTNKHLDYSIFVGIAVIVLFFWLLDAQSYYYQEKLRTRMKVLAQRLALRYNQALVVEGVGMPLDNKRETRSHRKRLLVSCFNSSMFFYLVLILIAGLLFLAFDQGWIM